MRILLFFLLSMICIISCNDVKSTPTQNNVQKNEKPLQVIEDLDAPLAGNHYEISFFNQQTFNEEEVKNLKSEKFFILSKNKTYKLENVNIEFQKDSLDEKKFLLKLPKKDTILFITKDTDLLKSKGQLKIADVGSKFIKPSDKISFQFNGKEYQLYAIGEENKDKTIPYSHINYKLYFTAEIDGRKIGQTLIEKSYFDVKNPQIYFVGDLDGDEKLDLILNTSYQKEENPTIYLSKNASVGSILSVSGMKLSK
jgi:hypothetical protein